jgi:hypothetical protein
LDEVLGFLNIRSKQFGAAWVWAWLLGLRRGLSKSFGDISSFLEMGLGFLNVGLDIVPKLLDEDWQ